MNNQQRGQSKGSGGGDPGSGENKNVAFAINALHGTYKSSTDKSDERQDKQFLWTRRTAFAAITYTVITVALLAAGIYSAIQASNAVAQAANAVGEAKRSADAAQAQVGVSTDTEHRQLRAYVGLSPSDIENFGDRNQKFTFERKNHGLTPAYDVFFSQLGQGTIVYGQPIPALPQVADRDIPRGNVTVFPSAELKMDILGFPANQRPDTDKLTAANSPLRYVYSGTIKYRDAFGEGHYTNFCWMFKGSDLTGKDAEWCQGHNDSD